MPVFGEVADVANGLLCLAEGNSVEAALAFAAVVPIAGAAVTGAKFTRNAAKAVRASRTVARIETGISATAAVGRAGIGNIARFGRRGNEALPGGIRNVGRSSDEVGNARRADSPNSSCVTSSFVPRTNVLMADGSVKPIEEIELGDMVWATNPVTGEQGPRAVTALRGSYGDKVLVEFTVDGELFVGTDNHPIWVVNRDAWVHAEGLQVGDQVLDAQGEIGVVDSIDVYQVETQQVHNLTSTAFTPTTS